MNDHLVDRKCKPCEGGMAPLDSVRVQELLKQVSGWSLAHHQITKTYLFKNYYQTVAFVNAVAWLAHVEDHHPNLEFGYKSCRVTYTTHAIKGLSENDFICAAKVDALLR